MRAVSSITAFILAIFATATKAQKAKATDNDFKIFTCGALGGAYAREITSFFIAETHEKYKYLSMDAGTSLDCINVAGRNAWLDHIFDPKQKEQYFDPKGKASTDTTKDSKLGKTGYFRKKQLNGFLVTHAHADHQAGLVISSAEDDFAQSRKPVIAPKNIVAGLNEQFSAPLWPGNFFYTFIAHNPADDEKSLNEMAAANMGNPYPPANLLANNHWAASKFWIKTYFLSHDTVESTAYRICNGPIATATACVLFFGDTGPDADEIKGEAPSPKDKHHKLKKHWWPPSKEAAYKAAANKASRTAGGPDEWSFYGEPFYPLHYVWEDNAAHMQNGVLNTIFIECSYTDSRIKKNKKGLFGHLTPKLIVSELGYIVQQFTAMNTVQITVVVMHLKPLWNVETENVTALKATMRKELTAAVQEKNIFNGYEMRSSGVGKSVEEMMNVTFILPSSQDMIYVKGGGKALYVPVRADSRSTGSAVPGYTPGSRVAAPRGDYYKPDYNGGYHHNNEGYGLFATEIVLVLALVCVVGLCFVVGLTFGGGVMWMAMIKKRKEKRTN